MPIVTCLDCHMATRKVNLRGLAAHNRTATAGPSNIKNWYMCGIRLLRLKALHQVTRNKLDGTIDHKAPEEYAQERELDGKSAAR